MKKSECWPEKLGSLDEWQAPKRSQRKRPRAEQLWPQELSGLAALFGSWALSLCNCGQTGIKRKLQALDVQHSSSFWSMPFVGVSLKLGSPTQHKEGKEQLQLLFYSVIGLNIQHSYFGPLILASCSPCLSIIFSTQLLGFMSRHFLVWTT